MNINVTKCCDCPFTIHDYEWDEYDCFYTPQEEIDKSTKKAGFEIGGKYICMPSIKNDNVIPPDWCPLRKEDHNITLDKSLKEKS